MAVENQDFLKNLGKEIPAVYHLPSTHPWVHGVHLHNRCCSSLSRYEHTPSQAAHATPSPKHRCKTFYEEQSVNRLVFEPGGQHKRQFAGFFKLLQDCSVAY